MESEVKMYDSLLLSTVEAQNTELRRLNEELLEALEELDAFCETGFENGTERKYVGSDTMHMVLKAITKAKGLDK